MLIPHAFSHVRRRVPLEFNPANRTLFSTLSRFDPLTYRPRTKGVLPVLQHSERKLMQQIRVGLLKTETDAATALVQSGLGPVWRTYAARATDGMSPAARARLEKGLDQVIERAYAAAETEKLKFNSKRPFQIDRELELSGRAPSGTSHPSGHSAVSYAAATYLAHFAPAMKAELLSAAANVARSRVVLGVHYPGDVAAGAQLGLKVGKKLIGSWNR